MGKRRSDADYRRFFDEFLCVKIPRLRATGAVRLEAPHTIIQFGRGRKLIGLAHTKFRRGGSCSYFRCPKCGRRANRLWLIEDRPHCVKSCNAPNIWHRTKWGFGRRERLKAKDKALDELIAKLDTAVPLRFNPAPKHWRGKAHLVANSRSLLGRMRRSLITCKAGTARAIDINPIWRAISAETLEQALDHSQITILAALDSADPQERLNAAKLMLRTKQAREQGW